MLDAHWIPEHAREYVENLNRPYTYEDVINIAKQQIDAYKTAIALGRSVVIFDTFLVITKVWFTEVFGKMPNWLEEELGEINIDLHLLCYPDLKWVDDGVRENESKREYLYERYKAELENYNFAYEVVKGEGEERLQQAYYHINQLIKR